MRNVLVKRLAFNGHAELAGHAARRLVLRPNPRNHALQAARFKRMTADAEGRFGGETAPTKRAMDEPANLRLLHAIDFLQDQPHLADRFTRRAIQHKPQSVAM